MRKPRDFILPHSKVCIAEVGEDGDYRYLQVHWGGTYEWKTAHRLAIWLIRASLWIKESRQKPKAKRRKRK